MNYSEYSDEMLRMRKKFGKAIIDDDKIMLAWRFSRTVSLEAFTRVVNYFIGEDVKPKLSDIRIAVSSARIDLSEKCQYCSDSGWIITNVDKVSEPIKTQRCLCCGGPEIDAYVMRQIRISQGLPLGDSVVVARDDPKRVDEIVKVGVRSKE